MIIKTAEGEVTIRAAIDDDAAQLRALRLEGLERHPDAFSADYTASAAETAEDWKKRLSRYAAEDEGAIMVAQVPGGQLIGLTGVGAGSSPKTRHSGWIWGVYVNQDWRGLGLAEAMIAGCMAWAQSHGLKLVKLGVGAHNSSAVRCYNRCGFNIYGIEPMAVYDAGVYYDELLMVKFIDLT